MSIVTPQPRNNHVNVEQKTANNVATITLHCGQYTRIYSIINGKYDSVKTLKNGKKFNSFLVPEPISRLFHQKYLGYVEAVSEHTNANIEQRITGVDTSTGYGW